MKKRKPPKPTPSAQDPPNDKALGEILGIDRTSVINHRRKHANAPRGRNVEEWRAFMAPIARIQTPKTESIEEAKLRLYQAQAHKIELANAVADGTLIKRADADAKWQTFAAWFTSFIRRKLENELPATMPRMDHAEARAHGKALVDEILSRCKAMSD